MTYYWRLLVSLITLLGGVACTQQRPFSSPVTVAITPPTKTAVTPQNVSESVSILVDDFSPQPEADADFWPYNRLGGDRGEIGTPDSGTLTWGPDAVTAIIGDDGGTIGSWTSLNHLLVDCQPLNFSAIFPPQIDAAFQGQITALTVNVRDGQGTLQLALQQGEQTHCPPQETLWSSDVQELSGGVETLTFTLPPLTQVGQLSWLLTGSSGDFVVLDEIRFTARLPALTTAENAFLWSYAMLLENWDPATGLTADRANFPQGEFDNVSASGMQAAAAVVAAEQGVIRRDTAAQIVSQTAVGLLALPRDPCGGNLWPHFVRKGQPAPGSEYSSIDTVIAATAVLLAQTALGQDTAQMEAVLEEINWSALRLANGAVSHGYWDDCERIPAGWHDFGTESWLVNLAQTAVTGQAATFVHTPPTLNGSGFIDELAWLLVPPACPDRWLTNWCHYSETAVATQLAYYQSDACFGSEPRLFGLSAAEVPHRTAVSAWEIYQAFGVGGTIPANDGSDLLGYPVVTPHYAGLVASLRPDEAVAMWQWLHTVGLFAPLNNVESLTFLDEPACTTVRWNALRGAWNLSLQTLGWGKHLLGSDYPLHQALTENDRLFAGHQEMSARRQLLPLVYK